MYICNILRFNITLTLIGHRVVIDLDEGGHGHLVDFVRIGRARRNFAPLATVRDLALAEDTLAAVHANIHGTAELHERRLGKLEGTELGRQQIAVDGVEVLEEVRVHGAAGRNFKKKFSK